MEPWVGPGYGSVGYRRGMEELLGNVDLDPIASPLGLVIVAVGVRLVIGAVKTLIKLALVVLILVGLYLFFYGGNVA